MKDKISMQDIEDNIKDTEIVKHTTKGGKILRWAILTTNNGFAVVGKPSATINALNDNQEIGEKVAIDNSKSEMWALLGYELSQKRFEVLEKYKKLTPESLITLNNLEIKNMSDFILDELQKDYNFTLGDFSFRKSLDMAVIDNQSCKNFTMYFWKVTYNNNDYDSFMIPDNAISTNDGTFESFILKMQEFFVELLQKKD